MVQKLSGCFHNYNIERKPEDFGQKCWERSSWYVTVLFFCVRVRGAFDHLSTRAHMHCVLQCVAVCCSVLQCTHAVCEAKCVAVFWSVWSEVCCRVLKCVEQSVLQSVEVCGGKCVAARAARWVVVCGSERSKVCCRVSAGIEMMMHIYTYVLSICVHSNSYTYQTCMQIYIHVKIACKCVYISIMHACSVPCACVSRRMHTYQTCMQMCKHIHHACEHMFCSVFGCRYACACTHSLFHTHPHIYTACIHSLPLTHTHTQCARTHSSTHTYMACTHSPTPPPHTQRVYTCSPTHTHTQRAHTLSPTHAYTHTHTHTHHITTGKPFFGVNCALQHKSLQHAAAHSIFKTRRRQKHLLRLDLVTFSFSFSYFLFYRCGGGKSTCGANEGGE